jgi:uncharacterized membrane protein (DUF106 family)
MAERTIEKEHVLSTLARTYLSILSDQEKEAVMQQLKKEQEFRRESEKRQSLKRKQSLKNLTDASTHLAQEQRRQFYNNLIKIGLIIILRFIATIHFFKKFIRNDTHFSSLYPFCKFFYHR